MFKCPICQLKYQDWTRIDKHLKKHHLLKAEGLIPRKRQPYGQGEHQCDLCNKKFIYAKALRHHQRQKHEQNPNPSKLTIKCSICNFMCSKNKDIYQHFESSHDIEIKSEEKQFPSLADFTCWKESVEKNTKSTFLKKYGVKTCNDGTKVQSFQCHRSGNFFSKSTGKRHIKTQGSCKINAFCPASMQMKLTPDGTCHVNFILTHIGHQCELGHLRLTKEERDLIASKKLRNRHKISLTMSNELLSVNSDSWEVVSDSSKKEIYTIKKVMNQCVCKIVCEPCNACIHQYTCTCSESSIKRDMCRHIHFVCRMTTRPHSEITNTLVSMDNNMDTEMVVIYENSTEPNELEILNRSFNNPKKKQISTTATSLAIKKQILFETLQKNLKEEINKINYEEQIMVVENQFTPLQALLKAVEDDVKNRKIFKGNSTGPANKNSTAKICFDQTKKKNFKQCSLIKNRHHSNL